MLPKFFTFSPLPPLCYMTFWHWNWVFKGLNPSKSFFWQTLNYDGGDISINLQVKATGKVQELILRLSILIFFESQKKWNWYNEEANLSWASSIPVLTEPHTLQIISILILQILRYWSCISFCVYIQDIFGIQGKNPISNHLRLPCKEGKEDGEGQRGEACKAFQAFLIWQQTFCGKQSWGRNYCREAIFQNAVWNVCSRCKKLARCRIHCLTNSAPNKLCLF